MAQTIKLKRSATTGNVPTTSQLALGELGINTTDGKLFLKKSVSGTESIVEVGSTGSFLPLSGGSLTGNLNLGDNVKLELGNQTNGDLQIYHNGSHSIISDVGTGNLKLGGTGLELMNGALSEYYLAAIENAGVYLYFDNTFKLVTTATGISISNDANFPDNGKAIFGAGNDLEIFSNGSTALLKAGNATSDIRIESDNRIVIADRGFNEAFAVFNDDSDVKLYHDGSQKIATTATGIDVTGSVTADGLTVDGNASVTANLPTFTITGQGRVNGFEIAGTSGDTTLVEKSNNGISFGTNNTTRLKIASNGDISFYNSAGSSQNFYWDSSTSSLGIGVTNVGTKLDITTEANKAGLRVTAPNTTNQSFGATIAAGTSASDYALNINNAAGNSTLFKVKGDGSSVFSGAVTADKVTVGTSVVNYSGTDLTVGDNSDSENGLAIQTSTTGNGYILFGDGSGVSSYNSQIRFDHSTNKMHLRVAGTETLIASTSGIDVTGSVTADGLTVDLADNSGILLQSPNTSSTAFINFVDSASSTSGSISYDHYTDALRFKTVNTERLRLASNGDISFYNDSAAQAFHFDSSTSRLGLGVTNPDTALHVETSADTIVKVEKTGGNYIQLHGTGAGGRIKSDGQINFDVGSNSGAFNLASNGNATFTGSVTSTGLTLSGTTDSILNLNSTDNGALYMAFKRSNDRHAYVGFGGTNDTFYIANEESGGSVQINSGNAVALTLNSSQNVNIPNGGLMVGSTTAPSYFLHIKGTTQTNAILAVESSTWNIGSTAELRLAYVAGHNRSIKGHYTNGLEFYTNPTNPVLTLSANNGNASFSGTISSGAITSSGALTGTRLNITDTVAPYIVFTEGSNEVNMGVDNGVFWIRQNGLGGGDELKINADGTLNVNHDATFASNVNIFNSLMVGSTTAPTETLTINGDSLTVGTMFVGPNNNSRRPFASPTNWGYSASYRATILGSTSTNYQENITGSNTISFNYDPSTNSDGSFSGDGREIIFRNGQQFVTPNSANNDFNLYNLVLKDGNVGIGTSSPSTNYTKQLHIHSSGTGASVHITDNNSGAGNGDGFELISHNLSAFVWQRENAALIFGTNSAERMRLNSDGSCRWTPDGTNHDMTLTAGGDLLVGKTSVDYNTVGHTLNPTGYVFHTRSDNAVLYLNRTSSSGDIAIFSQDGTTKGNISVSSFGMGLGGGTRSSDFFLKTDGTASFASGVNLGVGTSPDGIFHVKASSGVQRSRFESNNSHSLVRIIAGTGSNTGLEFYSGTGNVANITVDSLSNILFEPNGLEQARLTSGGDFLVGKTSSSFTTAGAEVQPSGRIELTRSGELMNLNRLGSDGNLMRFYGSSALVGSIGTEGGDLTIGKGTVTGLQFWSNQAIRPFSISSNSRVDNVLDLGESNTRFKDLYLSGNATAQKLTLTKAPVGTFTIEVDGTNTGEPNLIVKQSTQEAARFDASRRFLVGGTSFGAAGSFGVSSSGFVSQNVQSGVNFEIHSAGNSTIMDFVAIGTGTVGSISNTNSATAYNTSSDQRLKDNIVDAPTASEDIDAIQVRSFDWKVDGEHQKYGMVAQELLEVAPDAVTQGDTPDDMMGVDYSKLVPMLIKEIQSLRQRVAQLEE